MRTSDEITVMLRGSGDGVAVADAVAAVGYWDFSKPAGSYNELLSKEEGFNLRDKYGTQEVFNGDGALTDVIDRLDNRTQFVHGNTGDP